MFGVLLHFKATSLKGQQRKNVDFIFVWKDNGKFMGHNGTFLVDTQVLAKFVYEDGLPWALRQILIFLYELI